MGKAFNSNTFIIAVHIKRACFYFTVAEKKKAVTGLKMKSCIFLTSTTASVRISAPHAFNTLAYLSHMKHTVSAKNPVVTQAMILKYLLQLMKSLLLS